MGPFAFSLGMLLRRPKAVKAETRGRRYWSFCEGGKPGELVHFFRPGEEGRRHVITLIVATLKRGGTQLLTAQDEAFMRLRSYCHGSLTIAVPQPIRSGKAVAVTLNCHEDPENVASLTVWGYTEDRSLDQDDVDP
jgi:hypothetical protein